MKCCNNCERLCSETCPVSTQQETKWQYQFPGGWDVKKHSCSEYTGKREPGRIEPLRMDDVLAANFVLMVKVNEIIDHLNGRREAK